MDSSRGTARVLLGSIRRVKTAEQLDTVLTELISFISDQRASIQRQRGISAESSPLGGGASVRPLASTHGARKGRAPKEVTTDESSVETARACSSSPLSALVQDAILFCSVLSGAFVRRADHLVTMQAQGSSSRALNDFDFVFDVGGGAGGVDGAATGSDRAARTQQRRASLRHFKECVGQLGAALERLRADVVGTTAALHPAPLSTGGTSSQSRSDVHGPRGADGCAARGQTPDAVLTYGVGEVKDFEVHQRSRAMDRLRNLVEAASPNRWNAESIVEAVWEISEFSPSSSVFDRQSSQEHERSLSTLEATRVVTPLKDPLSHSVIRTPCRGERCVHLDVFDAGSFTRSAQRRAVSHPTATNGPGALCPLCRRFIPLSALRVDMAAADAIAVFNEEKTDSSDAAAARRTVTADHCLEWNMVDKICKVVEGKQMTGQTEADGELDDGGGEEGGDNDGGDDNLDDGRKKGGEGPIRKRRRVEIGGHVLFVDE